MAVPMSLFTLLKRKCRATAIGSWLGAKVRLPTNILLVLPAMLLLAALPTNRPRPIDQILPPRPLPPHDSAFGRVFRYSLIPGGVQSGSDFARWRNHPVLAEHYADLGLNLRAVTLDSSKLLYASYRLKDAIYWTANRVDVAAGEMVLTDGVNMVRARCGNRLSETPQRPTFRLQPSDVDNSVAEIIPVTPPPIEITSLEPIIPMVEVEVFPPLPTARIAAIKPVPSPPLEVIFPVGRFDHPLAVSIGNTHAPEPGTFGVVAVLVAGFAVWLWKKLRFH